MVTRRQLGWLYPWRDSHKARGMRATPRRRFRPQLDGLEGRALLSVFTVTNLHDDGEGSLRWAIEDANAIAGDDTIVFAEGVRGTIDLTRGLPELSSNIDLQGSGAADVTVRRDSTDAFRIFTVTSGATVRIAGLSIANGQAPDLGGGIHNAGGTLTVTSCILSGNSASSGGGISNLGGTLTVTSSTFSGNHATGDFLTPGEYQALGFGGGIYNGLASDFTRGILTVSSSTFSGNHAAGAGGGIFNYGSIPSLARSTLSGNSAYHGGGIHNAGALILSNSTLSGNTALASGGAIMQSAGTFTFLGDLYLVSTNATMAENRVDIDGDGSGTGGGIEIRRGPVALRNTLVATNFRGDLSSTTRDDVRGTPDALSDHNLIGDGTGMIGLSNGVDGNLIGTAGDPIDPRLSPLADHGGSTFTHALLPDSPAIDAGTNYYYLQDPTGGADQRGFARIAKRTVDIGAVESQASTTTLATSASSSTYGQSVTFTATVTGGGRPLTAGTVTFLDGTSVLAAEVPLDADGRASFSTSDLSATASPHSITARYSGAIDVLPSAGLVSQAVAPQPLFATVTAQSRVYDGTTAATVTGASLHAVDGAIAGGSGWVGIVPGLAAFDTRAVGTGKTVTVSGLALTGPDAGNYRLISSTATTTADITPRAITGAITAGDKVYDGTTAATISGYSLAGAIAGDDVSYSGGTATFADKNVGVQKTVTATGLTLAGADAGNYTVNPVATASASITPASLTVTAVGQGKTYDGTTAATVTLSDDRIVGDVLTLTYAAANFIDPNAGTGKTIDVTGIAISGPDAGNYTIPTTATTTADIAKADQRVTWAAPAPIGYGTALGAAQLNATVAGVPGGSAPGALTYSPPAGTVLPAGMHQALTVNAAATANYNEASLTVYLDVLTATQQADNLTQQVLALMSTGTLNAGQGGALMSSLSLRGDGGDVGRVTAFVNQVVALRKAGILTQAEAELLLAGADMLLVTLSLG